MNSVFKALADPTRRKILHYLNDGEMSAGDLAAKFEVSAPTMSHHFNVLKSAGMVTQRRDGQTIYYRLDTTVFQDVIAMLMELVDPETPLPNPDSEGDTK